MRYRLLLALLIPVLGFVLYADVQRAHGQTAQDSAGQKTIVIAPIHGEINRSQVILLRRAIQEAQEIGAEYLVVEIDTFGGRVDSALQITTLLGALNDIETIAFVPVTSEGTGVSWSAGALISFACDMIFMSPGTSIGAATPVTQQTDGTVAASEEKTLSAIRTQMAALAEKNGYPLGIALAMVDRDVELAEVYLDGELIGAYTESEYERLLSELPNQEEAERTTVVSEMGKLLTLTAGQMDRYMVSGGLPTSYQELYQLLGIDTDTLTEVLVQNDQLDSFVAFLTSGAVVSLLIVAGLIGLFLEITSPGFGLPGILGLLAFAIVFGANFLLGRVESVELLLMLCGVILILLELFLIPGFGVAGISGIICVGLSLILAQQDFTIPQFAWQWRVFGSNILYVGAAIVGGMVVFLALTPVASKGYLFRRIALTDTQDSAEGYTVQKKEQRNLLLGKEGVTTSVLRPSGRAKIENKTYVVESEGEFIKLGVKIIVSKVDSNRILVQKV